MKIKERRRKKQTEPYYKWKSLTSWSVENNLPRIYIEDTFFTAHASV